MPGREASPSPDPLDCFSPENKIQPAAPLGRATISSSSSRNRKHPQPHHPYHPSSNHAESSRSGSGRTYQASVSSYAQSLSEDDGIEIVEPESHANGEDEDDELQLTGPPPPELVTPVRIKSKGKAAQKSPSLAGSSSRSGAASGSRASQAKTPAKASSSTSSSSSKSRAGKENVVHRVAAHAETREEDEDAEGEQDLGMVIMDEEVMEDHEPTSRLALHAEEVGLQRSSEASATVDVSQGPATPPFSSIASEPLPLGIPPLAVQPQISPPATIPSPAQRASPPFQTSQSPVRSPQSETVSPSESLPHFKHNILSGATPPLPDMLDGPVSPSRSQTSPPAASIVPSHDPSPASPPRNLSPIGRSPPADAPAVDLSPLAHLQARFPPEQGPQRSMSQVLNSPEMQQEEPIARTTGRLSISDMMSDGGDAGAGQTSPGVEETGMEVDGPGFAEDIPPEATSSGMVHSEALRSAEDHAISPPEPSASAVSPKSAPGTNTSPSKPLKGAGSPSKAESKIQLLATKPKKKSVRRTAHSQLDMLLNARYNDKGEIISPNIDKGQAEEQDASMEDMDDQGLPGGSGDGDVVMQEVGDDPTFAPTGEEATSAMDVDPTPSVEPGPIEPVKPVVPSWNDFKVSDRLAARKLLSARYNERGEIIEDDSPHIAGPTMSEESKPSKKGGKKAAEGKSVGKGKGKAKQMEDAPRAATPAYSESVFEPEGTPVGRSEDSASVADPNEKSKKKRAKPLGSKNSNRAELQGQLLSSEPLTTPVKGSQKKAGGKGDRAGSAFAIPEYTPEKPTKKTGKASKVSAQTLPERASSASLRPADDTASARRTKEKADPTPDLEEEEKEDDTIYCICRKKFSEDSSDMVECDLCQNWYHFRCMQLDESMLPLIEQYVCTECEKDPTISERTSWKVKCVRDKCNQPGRTPLSKFCSDTCGIHHTLAKLQAHDVETEQVISAVHCAPKPEGFALHHGITQPLALSSADTTLPLGRRTTPPVKKSITYSTWRSEIEAQFDRDLAEYHAMQSGLEARMADLAIREGKLADAIARAESLSPLGKQEVAEAEKAQAKAIKGKKSKAAVAAAQAADERPCGYDPRLLSLSVDDGDEAVEICQNGRKRCERHAGWEKMRTADLELERAGLIQDLDKVQRRIDGLHARHAAELADAPEAINGAELQGDMEDQALQADADAMQLD